MEYLLFWLMLAVICGMVASSKGRSFLLYFLGGLLLWPIVLVAAIIAKPKAVPAPAFAADGLVGRHIYRRQKDGSVIVLLDGREVRFASLALAEAALDKDGGG